MAESQGSFPKSIIFLIGNEFCERFNYYGLRAVLSLYLTEQLHFTEHEATLVYHFFVAIVYALPVFGAMVADSWLGKFRTILYISMVYAVGNVVLSLSAIKPLHLPPRLFALLGLFLIAVGTGGIKPCLAAFGGDQFNLPQQEKQLNSFFHMFYFSINAGSLLSMFITPVLRARVHCFGQNSCYSLAFIVPSVLMALAVIVFAMGRPLYKVKDPEGNMVLKISTCIWTAIILKCKSRGIKKDHWLDFAVEKHGEPLVNDIKAVLRVLYLYLPVPLFWALFEQQATGWTFQARRMNGEIGNHFTILPDQMQVANPICVLVFIPIFNYLLYPTFAKINLFTKPLQRIGAGGVLASAAFVVTAFVALALESTFPVLPSVGKAQIRIFNVLPCEIEVSCASLNGGEAITISQIDFYTNTELSVAGNASYTYSMSGSCSSANGEFDVYENEATAYFFKENGKSAEYVQDQVEKLISGNPNVRTIINLNRVFEKPIDIRVMKGNSRVYLQYNSSNTSLIGMSPDTYDIQFGSFFKYKQKFSSGGVYTIAAIATATNNFEVKALVVTPANSIHILWLIPQYVVITMAEIMFAITGIEFSYSQAPKSMKSVLQAGWLLTYAFGQIFVVIIELLRIFSQQSSMFFLYAAVMILDVLVFIFLAMSYTYVQVES